jgi:hypothetical protein
MDQALLDRFDLAKVSSLAQIGIDIGVDGAPGTNGCLGLAHMPDLGCSNQQRLWRFHAIMITPIIDCVKWATWLFVARSPTRHPMTGDQASAMIACCWLHCAARLMSSGFGDGLIHTHNPCPRAVTAL